MILIRSEVSVGAEWDLDPAYITVCLVFTNQQMCPEKYVVQWICVQVCIRHTSSHSSEGNWLVLQKSTLYIYFHTYLCSLSVPEL